MIGSGARETAKTKSPRREIVRRGATRENQADYGPPLLVGMRSIK